MRTGWNVILKCRFIGICEAAESDIVAAIRKAAPHARVNVEHATRTIRAE